MYLQKIAALAAVYRPCSKVWRALGLDWPPCDQYL